MLALLLAVAITSTEAEPLTPLTPPTPVDRFQARANQLGLGEQYRKLMAAHKRGVEAADRSAQMFFDNTPVELAFEGNRSTPKALHARNVQLRRQYDASINRRNEAFRQYMIKTKIATPKGGDDDFPEQLRDRPLDDK